MSLESILSQEIVQRLGWTLVHFVWQATAVALLAAVLLASLRKSTANIRYIIACAAMGLIVLLPAATIVLVPVSPHQPTANIEAPPPPAAPPMQAIEERPLQALESREPLGPRSINATPAIPWTQRAADRLEPALPYLVTGWVIGVFGLSLWHLGGWAQLQRLRRKLTKPVDAAIGIAMRQLANRLGVNRAVELLESALVQVPTVVGWLRPVILLPASALTGLTPEQLEALLAHELAHIRRHDYLVNMLQMVIETLGFYHPAVWWVSHRIRIERENCCDDLAVGICGDRLRYARALTSMEEIRAGRTELAVAASGGNLLARIRRLIGKDSSDGTKAGWLPSVITILLIAIIAIPAALALSTNKTDRPDDRDLEAAWIKGFRENRDKFKCGVLAWSRTTINDGFGSFVTEKYDTKGSFEMWWDGNKIATKYADERLHTDPTGRRWIETDTGRNTYDGGLLSRKPTFGSYENWLEQVIRWQGYGSLDNLLVTLKKQKHVNIHWSIVDVNGNETFKLVTRNMDKTATDYGAYAVEYYDPSKGYGLVNQEWYNSDGRPRMKQTVKLQQVIPNGWFPVEVEVKGYSLVDGTVYTERRLALDLERCSFNDRSAMPKGIFDFSAAKEHERLNEILKRLSQGVVADEADDNVKGPLESAENYVAAALAGEDQKAAEYASPGSAVAAQTKDTREILQGQDIQIGAACIGEWNALAISSVIQADHGRVGSVVFHLKKTVLDQKVHWLIDDIDIETLDKIEPAIKRFTDQNPKAKTVIIRPDAMRPDGSATDQAVKPVESNSSGENPREQADAGAASNDAMPENEMGLGTIPKAKYVTLDPKTKRLEHEFGFERLLHKDGDMWEIEKPYMNIYRGNSAWYITADKGQVKVETAPGRTTPQSATFSSNVVIHSVADSAGRVEESFLYCDSIVFSSDQSLLMTAGPFRFVSQGAQIQGTGVKLIYNEQAERFEYSGIADSESLRIKSTQPTAISSSTDRHDANGPAVAKSPAPSDADKAQTQTVRVELAMVEASSETKLDTETVVSIRNILGGKITLPESPAAADLLKKASEAMTTGKNELTNDKRVTQEQFNKLFDLLVSRGYLKILLRPTLEVVEGQTAQIKIDRNSLEVLVRKVQDDAIDLQVQADLMSPVADSNDQTPMFSIRTFSTRVYINSGQSLVVSGLMRPAVPRDSAERPPSATAELLCILAARITTPLANPMSGVVIPKGFDEMATRMKAAREAGNRPARQEQQKPEAASRPQTDSMVARVYDITDLVSEPADHGGMSRVMQVHNLITLIQERIAPESWYDPETEGKGTIRSFPVQEPKKLVVQNTVEVQEEIKRLLELMRSGAERVPAEYPRQMTIRGRCLDAGGLPLSNALVQLYCRDSGRNSVAPMVESRTDSEGRFTLGPVASPSEEDWGHKSYFVFLPAEGHGPAWKTVNLYQETIEPLELRAYNSATVSGSVVTEDSKPVAGAQVWVRGIVSAETSEDVLQAVNRFSTHVLLPGWSATTDSDGAFRIAGVPDGTRLQLFVLHRDFAGRIVHVKAGAHTKIEVHPAAAITGRVVYGKTGKPAAGVVVWLQRVDKDNPIPAGWMAAGEPAVTDEQGQYRLESLPAGKYNVSAKAEDLTVVALDSFEVKAGEVAEAPDLVFVEGGFITGRVIDEATGQPVRPGQRSSVAIYGPSHPKSGAAVGSSRIRDDGSFRIRVAPGSNHIYLMPQEDWGQGRGYIWVDVAEGQTVEVELRARKLSAEELEKQAAFWHELNSHVPQTLDELENSANRLKQLGLAIAMYANEHDDALPDGLQQLEGYGQDQQQLRWLLDNVEYLGKGKTGQPNAARVPIAYDRTLLQRDYSDYRTEVLFLDFSVRFVGAPELADLGIKRIRRPTQAQPDASKVKQVDLSEINIPGEASETMESARRLSSLGKAMRAYANDHGGKYPAKAKLYELQEYLKTVEYAWPNRYEYLAEGKTTSDRPDIIIYYDTQLFEQGKGTNVLFNDGRVEFLGPQRLNELNINKTQILIETRILEVTDDFLKENQLDANSVRTGEIRSVGPDADSAAEPNSPPYCLVFDDNDVNLLLKGTGTPQGKDNKMLAAPKAIVLDGRPIMIEITREIPVPVPGDPNGDSGKAESKPKRVKAGTSIKITPDALPDGNNVLLDFEWEHSQVRGFEQQAGPDGKKHMVPVIDRYNMRTRATVPDGKTLLIGGKKIRRLVVTSTKKPLLGDLPLIGSLFRSESRLEETRNVLILIKPTVDPKKKAEAGGV